MSEVHKPIPFSAIKKGMLAAPEHQTKEIIEYVEWQLNKGTEEKSKVTHLEKVKSEVVYGQEYVIWDVYTDRVGRWWVITAPTNLYSQEEFPSLDYTLSFHVGVTARIASNDAKRAPESRQDRLRSAWRIWENAAESLDHAEEPEDFQAIGMMCRECLVEVAKSLQHEISLPDGQERPKDSDFINWSEIVVSHFASGQRKQHIRNYLKSDAKESWQLVNWLTHTSSARLYEAQIELDATAHLLGTMSLIVMQAEMVDLERCPKCKSYRIVAVFDSDLGLDPPYVNLCEACGWNSYDDRA